MRGEPYGQPRQQERVRKLRFFQPHDISPSTTDARTSSDHVTQQKSYRPNTVAAADASAFPIPGVTLTSQKYGKKNRSMPNSDHLLTQFGPDDSAGPARRWPPGVGRSHENSHGH